MAGGPASSLAIIRLTKDDEWLLSHLADPMVIAPGVRPDNEPAPQAGVDTIQGAGGRRVSAAALLRQGRERRREPDVAVAADVYASICIACHKLGASGGTVGPDLTHVGSRRDEDTIRRIIEDPLGDLRRVEDAAVRRKIVSRSNPARSRNTSPRGK